jgi:hypothetical protein
MYQLTDLPDDASQIPDRAEANARIREEGTANLIAAAQAAGAGRFLAQSIAWTPAAGNESREDLEAQVLAYDGVGVVLRYGQFYGPGTYYEAEPPDPPRIEIGAAACGTVSSLEAPTGIVEIIE